MTSCANERLFQGKWLDSAKHCLGLDMSRDMYHIISRLAHCAVNLGAAAICCRSLLFSWVCASKADRALSAKPKTHSLVTQEKLGLFMGFSSVTPNRAVCSFHCHLLDTGSIIATALYSEESLQALAFQQTDHRKQ